MKNIGVFFLVFILSITAFKRNIVWKEDVSLWRDTALKTQKRIRPHINLGVSYLNNNAFDKAIIEYQKAIEIMDNFYSHYNIAVVYEKKGFDDIAIREFKSALTKSSETPTVHLAMAYYKIARAYLRKDYIDEMIINLQDAVKFKPDFVEAYNDLGAAYGSKGSFDKAIDMFQTAININPDYAVAHYNMGGIFDKIGLYKRALSEYQSALRLDPTDENARDRIKLLQDIQSK